jgi:hypothetical protein
MKKLSVATIIAACAFVIAPSFAHVAAAPSIQYCYQVSCRGPAHKQMSVQMCGSTDKEARLSAEKWMGSHRGTGHSPSMGKMYQR